MLLKPIILLAIGLPRVGIRPLSRVNRMQSVFSVATRRRAVSARASE
jgi:hypothetical protein